MGRSENPGNDPGAGLSGDKTRATHFFTRVDHHIALSARKDA
jgi:hypothetical protein